MNRTEPLKKAQSKYYKKYRESGIIKGYYIKCHTIHDKDIKI